MLNLERVHKPSTLEQAIELLQRPGTAAMAGGTALISGRRRDVHAVVDLSGLGLAYIRENNGGIAIGAMTALTDLDESPILRALADGVLAQAAHCSAASILRNQVTVAGTLITEPDTVLAAALLALDAQVTIVGKETRTVALGDFLAARQQLLPGALLTQVMLPLANPRGALETVSRTPSDKPIISVCTAAKVENGVARDVRIALGGVAETAVRASAAEAAVEGQALTDVAIEKAMGAFNASGLSPRGDFRGSVEYRREMARVLVRRALQGLERTG